MNNPSAGETGKKTEGKWVLPEIVLAKGVDFLEFPQPGHASIQE
jgi:hypothetical protein